MDRTASSSSSMSAPRRRHPTTQHTHGTNTVVVQTTYAPEPLLPVNQWTPLKAALLPALLSFLIGSETGSDLACFVLAIFWLYIIISKPEEYYQTAIRGLQLCRSQGSGAGSEGGFVPDSVPVSELVSTPPPGGLPSMPARPAQQPPQPPVMTERDMQRAIELQKVANHVKWALFCTLVTPILGALGLYSLKQVSDGPFMSLFNVSFFLIGSGIRPYTRFFKMWQTDSTQLQIEVARDDEMITTRNELATVQDQLNQLTQHVNHSIHNLVMAIRESQKVVHKSTDTLVQRIDHLEETGGLTFQRRSASSSNRPNSTWTSFVAGPKNILLNYFVGNN